MAKDKELTKIEKFNDIQSYINQGALKKQFEMALPKWLSIDRFLRVCLTAILKQPKLLECTRESICSSMICCAQLGLEPILRLCYLIPYHNTKKIGSEFIKVNECTFQMGYKGYIELACRNDKELIVTSHPVYRQDEFNIRYGLHEDLIHVPKNIPDDEIIGAYTVWNHGGFKNFSYMPIVDINKRRDKSQAWKYAVKNKKTDSVWHEWPAEMAEKTVLKRHAISKEKLSIDFMQAVEFDNAGDFGEDRQVSSYLLGNDVLELNTTVEESEEPQNIAKQFSNKLSKDIDLNTMSEYILACVSTFNKDTDEIKQSAVNNFDQFISQYEIWCKRNNKQGYIEKKTKAKKTKQKKEEAKLTELQQEVMKAVNLFGQEIVDKAWAECKLSSVLVGELTEEQCENLLTMIETLNQK